MKKKTARILFNGGLCIVAFTFVQILSYVDYRRVAAYKPPMFAIKVYENPDEGRTGYLGLGYSAALHNPAQRNTKHSLKTGDYLRWGAEFHHWVLPLDLEIGGYSLIHN